MNFSLKGKTLGVSLLCGAVMFLAGYGAGNIAAKLVEWVGGF